MKWLSAIVLGGIATFCKQYGLLIALVVCAIVFDVITGLIRCKITGEELSSKKGTKGFFKKVALLVALFFGFFLDMSIPLMISQISIDLPFDLPFGLVIAFYIVINECISICENLYACDEDIIPKWVAKLLIKAKEEIMEKGESDDEGSNEE